MKKFLPALVIPFLLAACSPSQWRAQIHMFQAETAAAKGHELRTNRKISLEERLQYYRTACRNFLKAYRYNPEHFTLYRIDSAADSCLRVRARDKAEFFYEFRERYIREHPTENEYGDAGVGMMLEG